MTMTEARKIELFDAINTTTAFDREELNELIRYLIRGDEETVLEALHDYSELPDDERDALLATLRSGTETHLYA